MSATILLLSEEQTWILEFPYAKIAGNGDIPLSHAGYKGQSASNVMAHTSLNTIESSVGAAKLMLKLTLLDWKPRRVNHALIRLSVPTAKEITKLTPTATHFEDIASIESGIWKSMLRSMLTGRNWFVLKWTAHPINDCVKSQNFFTKCSQELAHHQHYPQNSQPFWYHFNPRTTLVWNSQNSKYYELWWRTPHENLPPSQLDRICKNSFKQ